MKKGRKQKKCLLSWHALSHDLERWTSSWRPLPRCRYSPVCLPWDLYQLEVEDPKHQKELSAEAISGKMETQLMHSIYL